MNEIKRTERGWPGHFIDAEGCLFRRNTLLECGEERVVVSSVGAYMPPHADVMQPIGLQRWYETIAFRAVLEEGGYWVASTEQVDFESEAGIHGKRYEDLSKTLDLVRRPDEMHEAVVAEISKRMAEGLL